ncbi:MAG: hypothetical protein F9K34_01455 [Albidovulum sp.]|jgi:hypothetical protein|uniref:hypothetical protein n=1 Tax=Albidovulum sp. TaxID=1872424 RepID=UPI00132C4DCB|nr:hypothetical protein [Defluviimonas sp.]KAB2886678.1 MAG: hypothetical protein F9K34_01455 [Defluviimonas sp.]
MRYDWILDVLTDLRAFSQTNGLKTLATQLEETLRVAETEIVRLRDDPGALRVADPGGTAGGAQTGGG